MSVSEILSAKLKDYSKDDNHEAIRAIGIALLKTRESDCELLNSIGNSARKLKDYKQANHFYRLALKHDNSYFKAFLNLSATLGQVEKYDYEVKESLKRFENVKNFFLPEFKNDLTFDKNKNFEQICASLRLAIKENWKKQSITEGQLILQKDIFNLGLYALSQKKADLALENFHKLKKQKSKITYVDMLILLAESQKSETADDVIEKLVILHKETPNDRYINGNLGLLYKKNGNTLLANKYFLICSSLLDKSEGFFSIAALARLADEKFQQTDYSKALPLYNKVSLELDEISIWEKIGDLNFMLNNNSEATKAFREIERLDPKSSIASYKLKKIYHSYVKKADELKKEAKFSQASVLLERALEIDRPPKLLENLANTLKRIKEFDKAEKLLDEARETKIKFKQREIENERSHLFNKGKDYMKNKDFTLAIEALESASRLRMDKDIFMYLAHIYKGLKMTRALQSLLTRWNSIKDQAVKTNHDNNEDDTDTSGNENE